jgi:hypothetical protein
MTHKLIKTGDYLLVVDDNKDIGENMWTVKDGKIREVSYLGQDNGYAIIAHLPLNDSPILDGVPLLPPYFRHQEDGVEEAGELESEVHGWGIYESQSEQYAIKHAYINGYNKAREKYKYTEEDMREALFDALNAQREKCCVTETKDSIVRGIIKSLHQYPTEFETEDVLTPSQIFYPNDVPYSSPKTITTTQGRQWVGKYK